MTTSQLMKHFRATIWDLSGAKEDQCERVLKYLSRRNSRGLRGKKVSVSERHTFISAKSAGLIYKSADNLSWVFDGRRYDTSTEALAALNEAYHD